jgi:hypothetical protein
VLFRAALPDLRSTVHDLIAEDYKVVERFTARVRERFPPPRARLLLAREATAEFSPPRGAVLSGRHLVATPVATSRSSTTSNPSRFVDDLDVGARSGRI